LPEYGIIVECGYSQSVLSLDDKAKLWFTVPTVETVITIKFVCATFANPKRKSGLSSPVDHATFSQDWVPGLGDIVYDGHTWAPPLKPSSWIHISAIPRRKYVPCPCVLYSLLTG
jgi:hypothetical protein